MSDFMMDLSGIYTTGLETAAKAASHAVSDRGGKALDMQDFLTLMVTTLQNQTIDNNADISDMMNQMVQMSMVTTMTNLSDLITATSNMSYAASLVGKEVTIGQSSGRSLKQIVGTVTGTGTVDGSPVVFVGGQSYLMSDIMAVGRLPADEDADVVYVDEPEDAGDPVEPMDPEDAGDPVEPGRVIGRDEAWYDEDVDAATDEADDAEYGVRDLGPEGT